jgi:uncharacterized protein involved in exopolysaccharide biosynthesis/photosystem II stability/assembly factor-like uncharacterized protein
MAMEKDEKGGNRYPREQAGLEEEEIQLIDFIYPLFKRRWLIILFTLVIIGVAVLFILLSTRIYEVKAMIMPEVGQSSTGNLQSTIAQQFGITLPTAPSDPSILFSNILTSRSFTERVVDRLNLTELVLPPQEEPEIMPVAKLQQAAADYLLEEVVKVEADSSKGSVITLAVQKDDPVLAVHIVNTYVTELDRYNQESNITRAKRLRLFLEERLAQAMQELIRAQDELRTFQEKHKALSISEQAKQTLSTLAGLEAKKLELEIQLTSREPFVRESHTQVKAIQAQIDAIQKNIDQLKYAAIRSHAAKGDGTLEYYIPLDQVPLLAFEENRLLLEVGTKSKVVEILTTQLEQTKLEEARELPTITVLEPASLPSEPVKPKGKLILVIAGVVGLFGGIMLAFVATYFEQETEDVEHGSKWQEMRQGIRRDFRQIVRLGKGSLWISLLILLTACENFSFWSTSSSSPPRQQVPVSLFAASYGKGIYQTTDSGLSWTPLTLEQIELAHHYVKVLALSPSPIPTLYVGTTGQGLYQVSLDTEKGLVALPKLKAVNVKAILIDPQNSEHLYAATWGQGVMRSQNGGQSWEPFNEGLIYLYVRTLAIAPTNPPTLYAGTIGGVFRRQQDQRQWEYASNGLEVLNVKALAIDPKDPQVIYAGTSAQAKWKGLYRWASLYRSSDSGRSWIPLSKGPKGVTVFTITLDPGETQRVFVGTGSGVSISGDGETWEDWSTGLPKAPVYSLVLVQGPAQAIFAATHGGVYRRLMGEEGWLPLRYGLESEIITALIPVMNALPWTAKAR